MPGGLKLPVRQEASIYNLLSPITYCMGSRRFHLRGFQKIKTEWTFVAMARNLRKMHLQNIKKAACYEADVNALILSLVITFKTPTGPRGSADKSFVQ